MRGENKGGQGGETLYIKPGAIYFLQGNINLTRCRDRRTVTEKVGRGRDDGIKQFSVQPLQTSLF